MVKNVPLGVFKCVRRLTLLCQGHEKNHFLPEVNMFCNGFRLIWHAEQMKVSVE